MQNQKILCIIIMLMVVCTLSAQNVGIGTTNPTKKLSVAGSIAVDHDNANSGTPDNASLLFGTGASLAAISSRKSPGSSTTNGLEFWTNGQRRMMIMEEGTVGINVENPDPNYDFFVGGSMRSYTINANSGSINNNFHIYGDAHVDSQVNINGDAYTPSYRLTVNEGHSYFGGNGLFTGYLDVDSYLNVDGSLDVGGDVYVTDNIISTEEINGARFRATEYMSVGGVPDPTYKLRVYAGNSRFGGDVQVTGTLNAGDLTTDDLTADDLTTNTINGKGVVRSNGTSSLRIGFDTKAVWLNLNGGQTYDLTANITDFEGGNEDIRVFVSQFSPDPLPLYANWYKCSFHIHSVDPVNDTCKVRVTNTSNGNLDIKGTLYLSSVAKD